MAGKVSARSAGAAYVDLAIGNTSELVDAIAKSATKGAEDFVKSFAKSVSTPLRNTAVKAGESASEGLAEGMAASASEIGKTTAKEIAGGLAKERGKYVAAGTEIGSEVAAGLDEALAKGTREAGKKVASNLSGPLSGLKAALGGVGLGTATAIGGAVMLKLASDFQLGVTQIKTDGGELQSNLRMVGDGILTLAGQTGQSVKALVDGAKTVEASGKHGADALIVLKAAAEGAKVGAADLGTTANALTTDLNAYGLSAGASNAQMSAMVATVAAGKMHMQDLAGSLSNVLPVAAAAGISFAQIGGAMATMTAQGMSADQASQDLANTIRSLQAPNAVAVGEMQQLGLSSTDLAQNLGKRGLTGTLDLLTNAIAQHMGPSGLVMQNAFNQSRAAAQDAQTMLAKLPPALQDIAKGFLNGSVSQEEWRKALRGQPALVANLGHEFATTAKNANGFNELLRSGNPEAQTFAQSMEKMLGGATGLSAGLMLTGGHMATFKANVASIAAASKQAGAHVKDWGDITQTFSYKLDATKGKLEALGIKIGTALIGPARAVLDVVGKIVNGLIDLGNIIAPVVGWFEKHKAAAYALATAVGFVVIAMKAHETAMAVSSAGGMLKYLANMKLISAATKAWTAVQWLLNIAMDANPIVLIGIAVAALVGGFIYAWTHFKGFRDFWIDTWNVIKTSALWVWHNVLEPMWHGIATSALWLWHNVLEPVGRAFVGTFKTIASAVLWVWHDVLEPLGRAFSDIFHGVATVALWLWHNVLEPAWTAIKVIFQVVWSVVQIIFGLWLIQFKLIGMAAIWLWHSVIEPTMHGIGEAIKWVWENVIRPAWQAFKAGIDVLGAGLTWLWHNVAEPVWRGIAGVMTWLYKEIVRPLFASWKLEIKLLQEAVLWLWHNVIDPVWHGIGAVFTAVWQNVIKPVFDTIKNVILNDIPSAFKAGVNAIKSAWNVVKDVAEAPIRFVLDTVLNKGIIAGYDKLADFFHVGHVNPVPVPFAQGGPVPFMSGAERGKDSILAMLTPGEGILTTDEMAKLGGPAGFAALRQSIRGYSIGGVVSDIVGAVSDPVGALHKLADGPIGDIATKFGNSSAVQLATAVPKTVLSAALDKVKGFVSSLLGLGSKGPTATQGNVPTNLGSSLAGWIAAAEAITGVGASWTGGLETLIGRESGGNPRAINLWDSNAQAGDPSRGLMQTIGSTFEHYRDPRLPDDIYNPVANITAGIRYILSRYGSIGNVQQANSSLPPKGYDSGGWLGSGDTGRNFLRKPEAVLTPNQSEAFMALARNAERAGGTTQVSLAGARITVQVGEHEFEGYVSGVADDQVDKRFSALARKLGTR